MRSYHESITFELKFGQCRRTNILEYSPTIDQQKNWKYSLKLDDFFLINMDIVTIASEISKDLDYCKGV